MQEELDKTKKRLIYKAKNRGSKESETILNAVCDIIKDQKDKEPIKLIDDFLSESDNDIFNWFFNLPNNKEQYKELLEKIKILLNKNMLNHT